MAGSERHSSQIDIDKLWKFLSDNAPLSQDELNHLAKPACVGSTGQPQIITMTAGGSLARGVDVIRGQIAYDFGPPFINETHNTQLVATVLTFTAENRRYVVVVSDEFDQDYGYSTMVNLRELGAKLRSSKTGRALVRTNAIDADA